MRNLGMLIGCLALLTVTTIVRAEDHPIILLYGDSMLDGCDPCGSFPGTWEVREFAWSGAETWHQSLCPTNSTRCRNGEDVVLPQGEPPTCISAEGDTRQCLAENLDADVVVLQWGTNDARKWCWDLRDHPLCEPAYELSVPRIEAAWSNILDAVQASGLACVIVAPPPVWSVTELPGEQFLHYRDVNSRLAELRRLLRILAKERDCRLLDLYQAFADVQEQHGEAQMLALYRNCPDKGGIQSAATYDCIHYSAPGRQLAGTLLAEAIEIALRLRQSSYLH